MVQANGIVAEDGDLPEAVELVDVLSGTTCAEQAGVTLLQAPFDAE